MKYNTRQFPDLWEGVEQTGRWL